MLLNKLKKIFEFEQRLRLLTEKTALRIKVAHIVVAVLNLATILLAQYFFGLESIGTYFVLLSVTLITSALVNFGFDVRLMRSISTTGATDHTVISEFSVYKKQFLWRFFGLIVLAHLFYGDSFLGIEVNFFSIATIALGSLALLVINCAGVILRARGMSDAYGVTIILAPLIFFILVTVAFFTTKEINLYLIWLLGNSIVSVGLIGYIFYNLRYSIMASGVAAKTQESDLMFGSVEFLGILSVQGLPVFLGYIGGPELVGLFGLAKRFTKIITLQQTGISKAAATVVREKIVSGSLNSLSEDLERVLRTSFKYSCWGFLIGLVGLLVYTFSVELSPKNDLVIGYVILGLSQLFSVSTGPIARVLALGNNPKYALLHYLLYSFLTLIILTALFNFEVNLFAFLGPSIALVAVNIISTYLLKVKEQLQFALWLK